MKKKRNSALSPNPGVARQYLMDTYTPVPDRDLKIGHIYLLFMENEKSIARTIEAVSKKFPCIIHPNDMRILANNLKSYRNLGREQEMEDFVRFCSEPFTKFTAVGVPGSKCAADDSCPMDVDNPISAAAPSSLNIEPVPGPSTAYEPYELDVQDMLEEVPEHQTSTVISSVHSSKGPLTPRKLKLKKRLDFISKLRSVQKRRYLDRIKDLNKKLDSEKLCKIKHLNQTIKRKSNCLAVKDAIIVQLKKELKEAKLGQTHATEKCRLQQLKRTHKRLKDSNKAKRDASKLSATVSMEDYAKLEIELSEKNDLIRTLETDKLNLEETVEELNSLEGKKTKKDGKTYSTEMRMMVYDAIINQVPTQNIPPLIESHAKRTGEKLGAIPHRTTVEQMARELGIIADLQTSEMAMKTKDLTLGFDATTQEGTHVNSIHFTTTKDCKVVAVDQLPGGTTEDYRNHICDSVDHLASVYSDYHEEEFQHCRSNIISNISNTMTDRAAVNHSAITKLNETWDKTLNELNCHLHPLDTIASSCRSVLKSVETSKGKLFGNDCLAGNLVLQINKFRYKDGKGDPKGFTTFLQDEGLPKGIIPRYRGNRLHILFHICGKLIEYHVTFLKFFTSGTVSCGGLQSSLRADFENPTAVLEMQVLGLLGKVLTGPWMQKFYTSADSEIDHVEGIRLVKNVIDELKVCTEDPLAILTRPTDFFGQNLGDTDITLGKLRVQPSNSELFSEMMVACLSVVISVLERQYKRYFSLDITDQLRQETKSARSHNIDAEEIMGMFSAGKQRAKNATLCFLSSRMRAKKNRVVPYLDAMLKKKRDRVVSWAVCMARKKRRGSRTKQKDIKQELSRRAAMKAQKKVEKDRKDVEKKLKSLDVGDIATQFPELENSVTDLVSILTGDVVGQKVCHVWYNADTREKTVYSGKIEKMKKGKGNAHCYKVAYWGQEETYDDAIDYEISKFEHGADFICEDLVLC